MGKFFEDITMGKAEFSSCGKYRYSLERSLSSEPKTIAWIMLNPSTATAELDDPTIRRCMGFSRQWGFGHMLVGNIFGLRATRPEELYKAQDPTGLKNWYHLVRVAFQSHMIIAAWGNHGALYNQGRRVKEILKSEGFKIYCLGTTKFGHPKHPLYLPSNCKWAELE